MQSLLVIGGGIETVPGIKIAKEMGLKVIVSDSNKDAPGVKISDDYIAASTYDVKETTRLSLKYNDNVGKINGVITIGSDVPLTVASVAKKLDLPGIPLDAAKLASNKILMKNNFYQKKIPIPEYYEIKSVTDIKEHIAKMGFPSVLKPIDSRGSRGVLKLTNKVDLEWAFRHSIKNSPSERLIIERYLDGPQLSTESIMLDGECYTSGFSDRNYEFLDKFFPHIIENGGDLPTLLNPKLKDEVNLIVKKAALSMGIENGIVKGDIVIYKNKPYVIELAARLSGGYFCTHKIPLNSGVNIVGQAIKMAIGEKINEEDLIAKYNKPVSQRYFFPKTGRLEKINGLEMIASMDFIVHLDIRLKIGDNIHPYCDHTSRAGMVITTGNSREEAIFNAEKAVNTLEFIVS